MRFEPEQIDTWKCIWARGREVFLVPHTKCGPRWGMHEGNLQEGLVAISPGVVLGPDVLVRVLDALLQRRQVLPVLPVLIPEIVAVRTSGGKGGDATTVSGGETMVSLRSCFAFTMSSRLCLALRSPFSALPIAATLPPYTRGPRC